MIKNSFIVYILLLQKRDCRDFRRFVQTYRFTSFAFVFAVRPFLAAAVCLFAPSQGDLSLTLLTFVQLINKLTDLPYPNPDLIKYICLTRRPSGWGFTRPPLPLYVKKRTGVTGNPVCNSWHCHGGHIVRANCCGVCFSFLFFHSLSRILSLHIFILYCRWCHTFLTNASFANVLTSYRRSNCAWRPRLLFGNSFRSLEFKCFREGALGDFTKSLDCIFCIVF